MRIDNYKVDAKINTNLGTFDISSHVRDIQIIYSLNLAIPEVAITTSKTVTDRYFKGIFDVDLKIDTYQHSESPLHTDKYKLIPNRSHNTMYSPTRKPSTPISEKRISTTKRDYMLFFMKQVFDTANFNVKAQILRNKKPIEVIEKVVPPFVEEFEKIGLKEKHKIPQIYLKHEPFLSILNYVKYWYGYSKEGVISAILPSKNPTDVFNTRLFINNAHKLLKEGPISKTFKIRNPSTLGKAVREELSQNQFVIDFPIEFESQTIDPVKYTIIGKPHNILFKKLECKESKLINKYGAIHKFYSREVENVSEKYEKHKIISNHPAFKCCFDPIVSMLAYEYSFITRGVIKLQDVPSFRIVWPGDVVKVISDDPDQREQTGLYLVESVIYRLSREHSTTWENGIEITIVRTNMMKHDVNLASPNSGSSAVSPMPIGKVNDISGNMQNIKNKTNSFGNDIKNKTSEVANTVKDSNNKIQQASTTASSAKSSIDNNISNVKNKISSF